VRMIEVDRLLELLEASHVRRRNERHSSQTRTRDLRVN
jgi:hypothetical protein